MSSKNKIRPSPSKSATLYKVGTKKTGNDGNVWIIEENKAGVKRWVLYKKKNIRTARCDLKKYVRINNNQDITSINLHSLLNYFNDNSKLIKLGELEITSNKIGVGELLYTEYPTKPGIYNIYSYMYSLIAIHEDEILKNQTFTKLKSGVACDIGMFAYIDAYDKYLGGKKRVWEGLPLDTYIFVTKKNRKNKNQIVGHDAYYVYESNFLQTGEYGGETTESMSEDTRPVAIFAGNHAGDGVWPAYKGKNAFLIMSQKLIDKISECLEQES